MAMHQQMPVEVQTVLHQTQRLDLDTAGTKSKIGRAGGGKGWVRDPQKPFERFLDFRAFFPKRAEIRGQGQKSIGTKICVSLEGPGSRILTSTPLGFPS